MSEDADDGWPRAESNGGAELQVVLHQCNSEERGGKYLLFRVCGSSKSPMRVKPAFVLEVGCQGVTSDVKELLLLQRSKHVFLHSLLHVIASISTDLQALPLR